MKIIAAHVTPRPFMKITSSSENRSNIVSTLLLNVPQTPPPACNKSQPIVRDIGRTTFPYVSNPSTFTSLADQSLTHNYTDNRKK